MKKVGKGMAAWTILYIQELPQKFSLIDPELHARFLLDQITKIYMQAVESNSDPEVLDYLQGKHQAAVAALDELIYKRVQQTKTPHIEPVHDLLKMSRSRH